jgi:hypothetical protein
MTTPLPPHVLAARGFIRRSDYCNAAGLARSTGCQRVRNGWPDHRDIHGLSWIDPSLWLLREPPRRREGVKQMLLNVYGPSLFTVGSASDEA